MDVKEDLQKKEILSFFENIMFNQTTDSKTLDT